LEYRKRRTALRHVSHLRRFAHTASSNTIKYWGEGKDDRHAQLDDSKTFLSNASKEEASTTAAELGISHPIPEHHVDSPGNREHDHSLIWRIRATQPKSQVSWDKARHELRGTHGAQLIYSPNRSNMATLTADRVVLDQQTGNARAEGDAQLERDGKTWSAHYMEYNFRVKQFNAVNFHSPHKDRQMIDKHHHTDPNLTIQAAQIDVPADEQILFHNSSKLQGTVTANILG
ncbi:uncharacterized protein METZ01_LOCUS511411, partial [marine metagenome]